MCVALYTLWTTFPFNTGPPYLDFKMAFKFVINRFVFVAFLNFAIPFKTSMSSSVIELTVPHNAAVGFLIKQLPYVGQVMKLNCFMKNRTLDKSNIFLLSNEGQLVTADKLSDHIENSIQLSIENILGRKRWTDEFHVSVRNSTKSLYFSKDFYSGSVRENENAGVLVKGLKKLYADTPENLNQMIFYSILDGSADKFGVRSKTDGGRVLAEVFTKRKLDREEQAEYVLLIEGKMVNGRKGHTNLKITVLDEDDNIPFFKELDYYAKINELVVGKKVLTVHAEDEDTTPVMYKMQRNNYFRLDSKSGDIFIKSSNMSDGSHQFIVTAYDKQGNVSPLPAFVTIDVSTALKFVPSHRSKRQINNVRHIVKRIPETNNTNSILFDISLNANEEVHFINSTNGAFDPGSISLAGGVRLKAGEILDFENPDQKEITIFVSITNRQTSEVKVGKITVELTDVNDESPYFTNSPYPYLATVSSNARMGTVVFTVEAEDPDTNSMVMYTLETETAHFSLQHITVPELNKRTGEIRVTSGASFSTGESFRVVVQARDSTAPDDTQIARAVVDVLVGLRAPQFLEESYLGVIHEEGQPGQTLQRKNSNRELIIKAISFQNKSLTYELRTANNQSTDKFQITPYGTVLVQERLDYEKGPQSYELHVFATEAINNLVSMIILKVEVLDENDNSPIFSVSTYPNYNVMENVTINELLVTVTASDADSGKNAEIVFSVENDNFKVETIPTSEEGHYFGRIRVKEPLDYETATDHAYRFSVTATDQGTIPRSADAKVFIALVNVNDEPPVIHNATFHVIETAEMGFLVNRLQAIDPDGDEINFYFETLLNTITPYFEVLPASGMIRVRQLLPSDLEQEVIKVIAQDDGSCCGQVKKLTSEATITILVDDVNNNAPQFEDCDAYKTSFSEEQPVGTFITQIHAKDDDRGLNGEVEYFLYVASTSEKPKFQVDKISGNVTTNVVFDRDEPGSPRIYDIVVQAKDKGSPSQMELCTFQLKVDDINDNDPEFDLHTYHQQVSQSAHINSTVVTVYARDKDTGKNAEVTYSLLSNPDNFFLIDPATGRIILSKAFPNANSHIITIAATDKGDEPRTGTATVSVDVTDANLRPPIWGDNETEKRVSCSETAPIHTLVTELSAISNVQGQPMLTFGFLVNTDDSTGSQNELGPFRLVRISDNSVAVRLRSGLNYNAMSSYILRVVATNQAAQPLTTKLKLTVDIIDKNNEIPQFVGVGPQGLFEGFVGENLPKGTSVVTLLATDADHVVDYRTVTYSIVGTNSDLFNIDPNSGLISTNAVFDREEKASYYLTVHAVDGAPSDLLGSTGHNTGVTSVLVKISDVNDNAPYFPEELYTIRVKEDIELSERVAQITALDKDENSQLEYSFRDPDSVLGVDWPGWIFVNRLLDYETLPNEYLLTLDVRDKVFSNSTKVKVVVLDVNDNRPVFSKLTYDVRDVLEEQEIPPGTRNHILTVTATDADIDRNTTMLYSLSGEGIAGVFEIDSSNGNIYLLTKLDRDRPDGSSQYTFNVVAEDEPDGRPLTGFAKVAVYPIDINDNKPIFNTSSLIGYVDENSPSGVTFMHVVATDYDAGENARITYSLPQGFVTNDGQDLFKITSNGGVYTSSDGTTLDREQKPDYTLHVRARDNGSPALQEDGIITIRLNDLNDNPPKFLQSEYYVNISESLTPGSEIELLRATDPDILDFNLQYTVSSTYFTIVNIEAEKPYRGSLRLYREVDFENANEKFFNLTVDVRDSRPNFNKDTAHVIIHVLDFNDNAPQITPVNLIVSKNENVSVGTILETFHAVDIDSGINAEFSWGIRSSTDPDRQFSINQNGVLTIVKPLDRETRPVHNLTITATDKGSPRQIGTTNYTLHLIDINDNYPIFAKDYRPIVMENQPPQSNILTFSAIDKDTPENGPPFKFSVPCSESNICQSFGMTFNQAGDNGNGVGIVDSKQVFDREMTKYYYLPVVMEDNGKDIKQTGTNTLTIEIGDENDNKHFPGHKDIFVYQYKGLFANIDIGTVYAEDEDDWDIGDKTFYYTGPDYLTHFFSLDRDTGMIQMKKGVPSQKYEFTASVYDRYFHKQNVSCTVTIHIEDIGDDAVFNSGSVRLTGVTAEDFVKRPKSPQATSPTEYDDSKYDKFRKLLAAKLDVSKSNVQLFSVMQNGEYTDVRYAAHGSPYYSAGRLDGIVTANKAEFQSESGITIAMVNIDECLKEFCEAGCTNVLDVGDGPTLVNANGTSFVGVTTKIVAKCVCGAREFSEPFNCSAAFCYNGGTCTVNDFGVVQCSCPADFDGPRCQSTKISFTGNGYALYAPLQQCEESRTSIEFVTQQSDGLIFYNGPVGVVDGDALPFDFISLELRAGYPVLKVNHGSSQDSILTLQIDGKDVHQKTVLKKLNDEAWHRIDIVRKGKEVTMIVDHCKAVSKEGNPYDRSPCEKSGETPGENKFININTPLQLGGRFMSTLPSYPAGITTLGFNGCMKNLIHNGELLDLKNWDNTGASNTCPKEDQICTDKPCGANAECVATSLKTGDRECICHPGYRPPQCNIEATVVDFLNNSLLEWRFRDQFYNELGSFENEIQLQFRTRDRDGLGVLFHITNSDRSEQIRLEIKGNILQAYYKFGDTEKVLSLQEVMVVDGYWHTVNLHRYGQEFILKMDIGEGRYYNDTFGNPLGTIDFAIAMQPVYVGGFRESHSNQQVEDDLTNACVKDIRMNNNWFPMTFDENTDAGSAAELKYNPQTIDKCERTDCAGDSPCPAGMECIPLWGQSLCRCPEHMEQVGSSCIVYDYCGKGAHSCMESAACINDKDDPKGYVCSCPPGWEGEFCSEFKDTYVYDATLTTASIVVILVSFFVLCIIVLVIILFTRFFRHVPPDKYTLDVDPDDDIREDVINYDEEGAGEEDQDGYDINQLRKPEDGESMVKPHFDTTFPRNDGLYGRAPRHGDSPDVGNFISDRMNDANQDPSAPPHDSVREYEYEGGGSDAGSLSSLNTTTSSGSHDYDYLNDWGPKFAKLADMYGANPSEPGEEDV